jgi:protein O-GlcNAc transferase
MPLSLRHLFRTRKTSKTSADDSGVEATRAPAADLQAPEGEPYGRAVLLHQRGQLDQAIPLYDQAIAQQPNNAEFHYKRANALNAMGRLDAALAGYDDAIARDAAYANAYCNRGAVLERLGRWDEALASYDRALALNEGDHIAHYNRAAVLRRAGHLLQQLGRHQAAVASYERALAICPELPEALDRRGVSLASLHQLPQALESYNRAIALRPAYAAAYINRGTVLQELQHLEEAVASYERGIQLDPLAAIAHRNRGSALLKLKRYAEAIDSYERALALQGDLANLLGACRHARMQICDWEGFETDVARIGLALQAEQAVCVPLPVVALFDEPQMHNLAARIWVRDACPPDSALGPIPARPRSGRIRVGYFSADFRSHPVSLLTAGMFEAHDRSKIETFAFAFGPVAPEDPLRARLVRAFEHFIDVDDLSDLEAASLAREQGIDIAVDLGGFTDNARTGIFALRAAPVQIGYLGYPGTSAAPYMDYLVADPTLIPPGSEQYYSEKIIYLPDSYQANDATREIATREFTRAELGLPTTGFVFCCFNRYFKLTPRTFESWMRILASVHGSVLWLTAADRLVVANLRAAATRCGIDPGRLVFAQRMPSLAEHLARQRAADLFLDTLPFNAHTTASDALTAGLPVLTCAGKSLAGRVAASLLSAVGLPELITSTMEEYEMLAVRLATHPEELIGLRQRLLANRAAAPLFDTVRFTRAMESALVRVYERSLAGLSPEHVLVA